MLPASAAAAIKPISTDPYTNAGSQHKTEVEPDTFSRGVIVVSTFQVGRVTTGGASNIGWATTQDAGASWRRGYLPGTTVNSGGTYDRISDPSVAFDAAHNTWLISSLAITNLPSQKGAAVLVSRSTDGGITWSNPVAVATASGTSDFDKNWTVCDNASSSPHYGHCYTEWDDFGNGGQIRMSTSTNGGLSWGAALGTANNATGLGGQPVVQSNGNVIVPIESSGGGSMLAFRSTDGGASWSSPVTVSTISRHTVAGGLRTSPLPTAEIDSAGKVYLAWQDCRFRASCASNDIVMSTSTTGTSWSSVSRIPIDATSSQVDHFIPGLGVDKKSAGASARLGLAYYYYPQTACTASTCQLDVGFVSSTNGGLTWSAPTQLAGPMTLSWLASTNQGRMVGDYISTSWSNARAWPVFAVAVAPSGGVFHEAVYTVSGGLAPQAAAARATSAGSRTTRTPARAPAATAR